MHADHQHVDPRPVGTRRLMTEIPKIPPGYLTTNQSEEYAQADQVPCNHLPHPVFKNPSPKDVEGFGSFEHEWPILLAWPMLSTLQ